MSNSVPVPFDVSLGRVWTSSAVRPLPTTSKIPEKLTSMRSSSSLRSLPAPLPVDGSSVSTARFNGVREGKAKSASVRNPDGVETELPVDGRVVEGAEFSAAVPERDLEAVKERGDDSGGDGAG